MRGLPLGDLSAAPAPSAAPDASSSSHVAGEVVDSNKAEDDLAADALVVGDVSAPVVVAVQPQLACSSIFRTMWCKYATGFVRDAIWDGEEDVVLSFGPRLSDGKDLFNLVGSVVNEEPWSKPRRAREGSFNFQPEERGEVNDIGGTFLDGVYQPRATWDHGVFFFTLVRSNPAAMHVPHMAPKVKDTNSIAVSMLPVVEFQQPWARVLLERADGLSATATSATS